MEVSAKLRRFADADLSSDQEPCLPAPTDQVGLKPSLKVITAFNVRHAVRRILRRSGPFRIKLANNCSKLLGILQRTWHQIASRTVFSI
jgi:hypothetical protein